MNEEEREKLQKSFGMHAIIEGKKYTMYIIEDDQRDCAGCAFCTSYTLNNNRYSRVGGRCPLGCQGRTGYRLMDPLAEVLLNIQEEENGTLESA